MKQIDWSLVPDWAEYVAMDETGDAWAYECEPTSADDWLESVGTEFQSVPELNDYIDRSQWRSSLARRPVEYIANPEPDMSACIGEDPAHFDDVSRPSHYVIKDGVEVIDVREWWLGRMEDHMEQSIQDEDVFGTLQTVSHLERAMEYLLRAPGKNGMEDVRKAYQYLHRAIHGEWPNDSNR